MGVPGVGVTGMGVPGVGVTGMGVPGVGVTGMGVLFLIFNFKLNIKHSWKKC